MAIMAIKVRPTHKGDVKDIVRLDRVTSEFEDVDFGVTRLRPWALSEEEVVDLASRADGSSKSAVVVDSGGGILGAFAYELLDDHYLVRYVVFNPTSDKEGVLEAVWRHILGKVHLSKMRKRVVFHAVDSEDADVRTHLSFWKSKGFSISLAPDYFKASADDEHGTDGWKCEWCEKA
jgi:hypothetical protein